MKTGRVIISKENSKGELLQKRFNFELKTSVEYLTVLNAIRGVVKSTYNVEVLGGIKHPKKYPVLTLEELLAEVSKIRFTEVRKVKYIELREVMIGSFGFHIPCLSSAIVNKGEVFSSFKIELDPEYDLVKIDYDIIKAKLVKLNLDMKLAESGFYYITDCNTRPEFDIAEGYYNLVMNVYQNQAVTEYKEEVMNL